VEETAQLKTALCFGNVRPLLQRTPTNPTSQKSAADTTNAMDGLFEQFLAVALRWANWKHDGTLNWIGTIMAFYSRKQGDSNNVCGILSMQAR